MRRRFGRVRVPEAAAAEAARVRALVMKVAFIFLTFGRWVSRDS